MARSLQTSSAASVLTFARAFADSQSTAGYDGPPLSRTSSRRLRLWPDPWMLPGGRPRACSWTAPFERAQACRPQYFDGARRAVDEAGGRLVRKPSSRVTLIGLG